MKAKPSDPTAAATAIAVAPARPAAKVRPERDGTTIARAASVAARPGPGAARPGPKASAAGLSAARGRIFAGASRANAARHRCRCPKLSLSLRPEEKGVESLARQIKMTGRAYPLFDIAQMILQKPERHTVLFSVKKNAEGKPGPAAVPLRAR